VSRRRRWTLALAAVGFAAVMAAPLSPLKHLAVPLIHDPSVAPTAARLTITDGEPSGATRAATLPGRISAILPRAGGIVFIGTFDAGLYRFDPARDARPVPVGGLDGRERFVDALTEHEGHVVAGTHRGAVVLAPDGQRLGVVAAGEAVAALAVVDGHLVAATAHGLLRDGAPLGERGPSGETLRATALAATAARLWIGTPDGVYALPRPLGATAPVARWHPLVFGTPPARTNVVTALAPFGDGVLAGTDDGGVVLVRDGGVAALPFADIPANDVNPGAMARTADAVFVGTEGAGLLRVDAALAAATRPRDLPATRISAVAVAVVAGGAQLYAGTEEGELWRLAAPQPLVAASRIF
jgi:ligand-binding sensor domain-containing protein